MNTKPYIPRILRPDLPANRSMFLWGPRKTGKTSFLKHHFPDAYWIDLLDYDLFLRLSRKPKTLRDMLRASGKRRVVIDEVQKIPRLMDEIHGLMESQGYQFILSGSSARKLRRSEGGLLGGRAWRFELFPFVTAEIGYDFDLTRALASGFIPAHFFSPDSRMDLKAYVFDYLKEEIQSEALTRNLPAFSLFLKSAALTNGMLLNYSNAAREAGVSAKTIREYYQILEDTLIGRRLPPWGQSDSRRLIETEKFYFFDLGLVNGLLNRSSLTPGTDEFGRAFEQFVLQECWAHSHYSGLDYPLSYWRTASGSEVDIILGNADIAIEVKSSEHVTGKVKGLLLFSQENTCRNKIIVCRESVPRMLENGIEILPWQEFCQRLWSGEIIQ